MRAAGDSELKVYGIFGQPLAHTVSPAIQNSALDHYGLKSIYFAFERPPARFRFLMRNLKRLLLDGFNLTVPYKEMVLPYLDRLDRQAGIVGAVNTVKKEEKVWVGYNTDVEGFIAGLHQVRFRSKGKSAVILGAGGAARAVLYGLAQEGIACVCVANRTESKASKLIRYFKKLFPKIEWNSVPFTEAGLAQALLEADLLVHTTKLGLHPSERLPVTQKVLTSCRKLAVYDLIYRPRRTHLLRLAAQAGHRVINGETMLLHQGARAFEIWTGKKAPISVMRKALRRALISV